MNDNIDMEVNTPRDALSLLTQRIYSKCGADVLPEIEEAWYKLGLALGKRMKKKLPDNDLDTVAQFFVDTARKRGTKADILKLDKKEFHLKGYNCALGLDGKGKELCWAAMGCDRGIFEAATGSKLKMDIIQSLAANDECCELFIELI